MQEVFDKIISKFNNIDICLFGTGYMDPKTEKDIDLEKIRRNYGS